MDDNNSIKPEVITKNDKFFSEREFNLQIQMGMEYLSSFINDRVRIFKVDKPRTSTRDLYGEVLNTDIVIEKVVDIPAIVNIDAKETKNYNPNGSLRYEQYGNITCQFMLKHLQESGVDVTYGDYIGYQTSERNMIFWQVSDDDQKSYFNGRRFAGYKQFWKQIIGTPVEESEFLTKYLL